MPFSAEESSRVIAGKEQPVITLNAGDATAEVLRGMGCNCVRWRIAGRDVLYAPPLDELAARPTRGGIPVLFPFPNRIPLANSPGPVTNISCRKTTRRRRMRFTASRRASRGACSIAAPMRRAPG